MTEPGQPSYSTIWHRQIWPKTIFFGQAAGQAALFPFIPLHMKAVGLDLGRVAVIYATQALICCLFCRHVVSLHSSDLFRKLAALTFTTGLLALLITQIGLPQPDSNYLSRERRDLQSSISGVHQFGLSCGDPFSKIQMQRLRLTMLTKVQSDMTTECVDKNFKIEFKPDVCGYLCPTRSRIELRPKFEEYKVVWPNRFGLAFGISEVVDTVHLDSPDAIRYLSPHVIGNSVFFPMNWTFHLSCDRISVSDCIFNPIRRAPPADKIYTVTSTLLDAGGHEVSSLSSDSGFQLNVSSIMTPDGNLVDGDINCGSKQSHADILAVMSRSSLTATTEHLVNSFESERANHDQKNNFSSSIDARFSGCALQCLMDVVNSPTELDKCRPAAAREFAVSRAAVKTKDQHHQGSIFWTYFALQVTLSLLTTASQMVFESSLMMSTLASAASAAAAATAADHRVEDDMLAESACPEYGSHRLFANLATLIFAPVTGLLIDWTGSFDVIAYIFCTTCTLTALLLLTSPKVTLTNSTTGGVRKTHDRVITLLSTVSDVLRLLASWQVTSFLILMVVAGSCWSCLETFVFWHLDSLPQPGSFHYPHLLLGSTLALATLASLPFLFCAGPLADLVGFKTIFSTGLAVYGLRLVGYNFVGYVGVVAFSLQALDGITMALTMSSAVAYVASLSQSLDISNVGEETARAQISIMMSIAFFGVGKAVGISTVGIISSTVSGGHFSSLITSFNALAGLAILTSVVYGAISLIEFITEARAAANRCSSRDNFNRNITQSGSESQLAKCSTGQQTVLISRCRGSFRRVKQVCQSNLQRISTISATDTTRGGRRREDRDRCQQQSPSTSTSISSAGRENPDFHTDASTDDLNFACQTGSTPSPQPLMTSTTATPPIMSPSPSFLAQPKILTEGTRV